MLGQILTLILLLGVIPLCIGLIPVKFMEKHYRSVGVTYISGFITYLAVFQIVVVPIVILHNWGMQLVVPLFSIISVLLAAAGVVLAVLDVKKNGTFIGKEGVPQISKFRKEEGVYWIVALLLIAFQMFMAFTMTSFDGDDAYYVVQSVLSYETDTMYRILPYTGLTTSLDLRHALAVFPIWVAYIARMSGIHATIVAHSILPLVLIPLTYGIYHQIGKVILKREKHKLPIFMIFVSLLQIFGNVSIYTDSTFFLTRTWQGKSILANVVLPAIVWLILWIFESENYEKEHRVGLWVVLITTNFVAAMSSTASVFLAAMLIGVTGLVMGIKERSVQIPLRLMIGCIPLVIYGVLFLLL